MQHRCRRRSAHPLVGVTTLPISRFLITLGLILIALGLLWPFLSRLGLDRLPGDILIQRDGFTFYFPVTTAILVGVVLSLILWLLAR